ncbi:MAG: HAMP domain-containing histidine kinase [Rhodocyclaceae bacterium]|nr:HAMP domain-containing histidine kinase [Rhodocyclaceae bacterium]MBK6908407.1 HAMP domain-containing histidine kinase [Rhodocyclaceae bacterium]
MARRQALARRIVIAFRALTLAVSGLFSLTVVGVVLWVENDVVSESMDQQIDSVLESYQSTQRWPELLGNTRFYAPGLTEEVPVALADVSPGFTEIVSADNAYYVFRKTIAGQSYILVRNQGEFEAQERLLYAAVIAGFMASVVLAGLIGNFTASRVMDPVIDLARRVRNRDQLLVLAPALAPDYSDDEVGQLAAAFDAALGELRAALERERFFTSDVSHELRTPLMIIASSCELLSGRVSDPRSRELVGSIHSATMQMHELVQVFLLLARATANQSHDVETVSLGVVAREQYEAWAPKFAQKGLDFQLQLAPGGEERYPATFLRVVIGNLLRNAWHYTDSGQVVLKVGEKELSVQDTGIGIPPSMHESVLQPFVRLDHSRGDGLGLGLSLVRRICTASGWVLRLQARTAGGTQATVRLER